jgi:hypothetical protein
MVGSQAVAAWIAQLALDPLGSRRSALGNLIRGESQSSWWVRAVGYLGLPHLSQLSGLFVTPYIATLDIVLVFMVFKDT